jgi:hypothetical protein
LTGIFADNAVATMSGDEQIKGGWINGNVIFDFIITIF